MNIYILCEWLPFPESEQGGLYVVKAHNIEEVQALLGVEPGDEYYENFLIELSEATVLPLSDSESDTKPEVVASFTT